MPGEAVKAVFRPARRVAIIACAAIGMSGCSMTAGTIDTATRTSAISMADPTPSIAVDPFGPARSDDGGQTDRLIDEDTIRLSVTTADLDRLPVGGMPWASAATGSSGMVRDIRQQELAGQTCRTFAATRNAYDGVTLYRGEVCLDPRSGWWTRSMIPQGGAAQSG